MTQTHVEPLTLPADAIAPLSAGIKSIREALLVLDRWAQGLPPAERIRAVRDARMLRRLVVALEQQVVLSVGTKT